MANPLADTMSVSCCGVVSWGVSICLYGIECHAMCVHQEVLRLRPGYLAAAISALYPEVKGQVLLPLSVLSRVDVQNANLGPGLETRAQVSLCITAQATCKELIWKYRDQETNGSCDYCAVCRDSCRKQLMSLS